MSIYLKLNFYPKMKFIPVIIFLVVLCISSVFGATARGVFNDPKHPGKCTIQENLILSPGDTVKDPNQDCGRIICGNDGLAEFQTCGVQSIEGCQLGDYVNKSLPYPECCERHIICK